MITKLKNKIVLKDGLLTVTSRDMGEVEYAFYLRHKKSVEKVLYSNNRFATFNEKIVDGDYRVVFFRRPSIGGEVVLEEESIVIHKNIVSQRTILAESDCYKLCLHDVGADVTFITFNGIDSTKDSESFGLNFLLSKGYNVITCAQNADQYQGLAFTDFKTIVLPYLKNKKVFLYGSSLGGYCALYYAGAVNGTVIAAAPRNSAHPIMIKGSSNKYKKEEYRHVDIIDNEFTEKPVYVLVDPFVKEDVFFLDQLVKPAYRNCHIIEVPYAGHEVLMHINKTRKLSLLIELIVEEDNPVEKLNIPEHSEFTYYGRRPLQ
ncbi:hypothetical protein CEQ07_09235 [Oligella urethralis]|uniref:hypothetical protein n=1 Tax=Oligella urethralis TaxID=90245 RepID=UPI000D002843|nr:hypothetical protein [Oligella urethralis]AVL71584.1 hypothetical protein CEQ07_09235 [Oligella urethralis]